MYKSIIFIIIVILGGCTINMTPPKTQPQLQQQVLWPHEKKEYWYARYFHTMASNPDIQRIMRPDQLFEVVKCTVDQYEKDHDWKWFQENLGNNLIITQENTRYVYNVTKKCADIVKAKMPNKPKSIKV